MSSEYFIIDLWLILEFIDITVSLKCLTLSAMVIMPLGIECPASILAAAKM